MTTQYRPPAHPAGEAAQSLAPKNKAPKNKAPKNKAPKHKAPQTAPIPCRQVSREELPSSPKPINQTCPDIASPTTNPSLNLITPNDEANYDYVHHILIGSPQGVTDAINRLHLGHRIERHRWTPLIAVREAGIHITPAQGQVISYLIQQRYVEPT
ncbi:MAG: hypothetical protein ACFB4J_08450 [Elainellaceae cyanobacterium]